MRDFTVPTGMSSRVAMSAYSSSCTSRRTSGSTSAGWSTDSSSSASRKSRRLPAITLVVRGSAAVGRLSVGSSAERRLRARYVERALLDATTCSQVVKRLRPPNVLIRVATSRRASCAASSASSG